MATKGKRPMRALTPSDKIEAIQRVNEGESKASVARDIGVPESTLRGWCKNEDKLRYMTTQLSSTDTDKSNEGEPSTKRARTESPAAVISPASIGTNITTPVCTVTTQIAPPQVCTDAPIELTTKRSESTNQVQPSAPRERRPDRGANVSMSAISPFTSYSHLPNLNHAPLDLGLNEFATSLSLLAQLNPNLALSGQTPTSRTLRSVRSPKPAHSGVLTSNENTNRVKSHNTDPYRTKSNSQTNINRPMDDTLWYWLKTQQALADLTAQSSPAHTLTNLSKTIDPSKLIPPAPSVHPHVEYSRNMWLWQYYKSVGGVMPIPEDKLKSASQVSKDKSTENILYSQLTKGKTENDVAQMPTSPLQPQHMEVRGDQHDGSTTTDSAVVPVGSVENKEPSIQCKDSTADKNQDPTKNQNKVRTVLDSLLYNNTNSENKDIVNSAVSAGSEWNETAAEALDHGEKFLAWLETSGDPSVTRMHVHQLHALLQNLRARRTPTAVAAAPIALNHASRRK